MHRSLLATSSLLLLATACEVPDPPPSTGGTDDDERDCAGVLVVSSDYQSTSVAFLGWEGAVISPHVLSSGSTESGGPTLGLGFVAGRLVIDFARVFAGLSADAGQAPTYLSLRLTF